MRLRFALVGLVFLAGVLLVGAKATAGPIEELRQRIAEKDAVVKELQSRAQEAQAQLSQIRGRERTLANEIASMDRQIESFQLEIRITEGRIERTNLRITQLELEIQQRQAQIAEGEKRLEEILRTMQVAEENIGAVELVFAGRPFSEVFDSLRSAELLNAALAQNVHEIKAAKAALETAKAESEEEKRQVIALRDDLLVKQSLIAEEQNEREVLLNETQQVEASYQDRLKNIENEQRIIQREVLELEAQLRRAINPSALPGKGVLTWPVDHVRITQGYGETSSTGFINDQYQFHNGVDFGARVLGAIGDPVLAAADGVIVGVGNTGRYAYGRWIAIEHNTGLVTLYAHLSLQSVSVGQQVQQGQVIGHMGNSGFSTGPHLHFTVYAASTFSIVDRWYGPLPLGGSLNPMNFLR